MKIDKKQYLQIFFTEANDYILIIEKGLVSLEQNPNKVSLLDELLRAAHTLKGSARMMGYDNIRDIAHKIEDTFNSIKNGAVSFKDEVADVVFSELDKIKSIINTLGTESKTYKNENKTQKQEKKDSEQPQDNLVEPRDDNTSEEYLRIPTSRVMDF